MADLTRSLDERRAAISAAKTRRLERFRRWLAISTRRVSPLALDVVAAEGLPLDRIVRWIRPAPTIHRRSWTLHSHMLRHVSAKFIAATYAGPLALEDHRFCDLWRRKGVVVRKPSHPRGRYGLWINDGHLNVEVALGNATLRVEGAVAKLTVPGVFPETVKAVLPGRLVGDVVEHPLFVERGYVVVDAYDADDDERTIIEFETGLRRFSLPIGGAAGQAPRPARRKAALGPADAGRRT